MKHLPKHLRPRWRYLAVAIEGWPDAEFDRGDFQRHLWYAAQNLLGDAASADVDLTVVRFSFADGDGWAAVRTRRDEVDRARAAVAAVEDIDGQPVGLRVAGVSGTVRACEEKYIRSAPEIITERTVGFEDAERTAVVRDGRADVRLESAFAGATTLDL
ncbi:ribonuclease P/MRP protein subunit POP5 [Halorientalis persicus]|jgi:ribonuclease P/MRP protein subunit POP5|uniref:Ribonuclease P protein component 2 n=1 Tax=Halorientalis persicus TaxID=1367881 RepID=A0A1H8JAD7_9EURY|nr:Rpp14/Pop5 family protein [Halorientalis persicus]SEN77581.1 ribonuclease P/MRP protein subunit POP5 [Halorientalis persicus]